MAVARQAPVPASADSVLDHAKQNGRNRVATARARWSWRWIAPP